MEVTCNTPATRCPNWVWDVANWTLIYTDSERNTKPANTPQDICYHPVVGPRVLKIVHPDGKEDYLGCTANTTSCKHNRSHYDHELGLRINTVPCCRKQVMELGRHVASVFEKHSITYVLTDGALIGWIRDDGNFVPYDHDIDFIVDERDEEKVDKVIRELEEPGFHFEYLNNRKTRFKVYLNTMSGSAMVDLWFFYRKEDTVVIDYSNWGWIQLITNILPPRRGTFEGHRFWFPNHPVKVLDTTYGKDKWKKVLSCIKHDSYDNCID